MKTATSKKLRLMGHIITPSSILMLIGSLISFYSTKSFLETANNCTGKVVELVERRGSDTTSYAPVFTFTLPNNRTYKVESPTASSPAAYKVNEEVDILYQPEDPNNARINSWSSLWTLSSTLALAGAFNFLVGIIFIFITRRKSS